MAPDSVDVQNIKQVRDGEGKQSKQQHATPFTSAQKRRLRKLRSSAKSAADRAQKETNQPNERVISTAGVDIISGHPGHPGRTGHTGRSKMDASRISEHLSHFIRQLGNAWHKQAVLFDDSASSFSSSKSSKSASDGDSTQAPSTGTKAKSSFPRTKDLAEVHFERERMQLIDDFFARYAIGARPTPDVRALRAALRNMATTPLYRKATAQQQVRLSRPASSRRLCLGAICGGDAMENPVISQSDHDALTRFGQSCKYVHPHDLGCVPHYVNATDASHHMLVLLVPSNEAEYGGRALTVLRVCKQKWPKFQLRHILDSDALALRSASPPPQAPPVDEVSEQDDGGGGHNEKHVRQTLDLASTLREPLFYRYTQTLSPAPVPAPFKSTSQMLLAAHLGSQDGCFYAATREHEDGDESWQEEEDRWQHASVLTMALVSPKHPLVECIASIPDASCQTLVQAIHAADCAPSIRTLIDTFKQFPDEPRAKVLFCAIFYQRHFSWNAFGSAGDNHTIFRGLLDLFESSLTTLWNVHQDQRHRSRVPVTQLDSFHQWWSRDLSNLSNLSNKADKSCKHITDSAQLAERYVWHMHARSRLHVVLTHLDLLREPFASSSLSSAPLSIDPSSSAAVVAAVSVPEIRSKDCWADAGQMEDDSPSIGCGQDAWKRIVMKHGASSGVQTVPTVPIVPATSASKSDDVAASYPSPSMATGPADPTYEPCCGSGFSVMATEPHQNQNATMIQASSNQPYLPPMQPWCQPQTFECTAPAFQQPIYQEQVQQHAQQQMPPPLSAYEHQQQQLYLLQYQYDQQQHAQLYYQQQLQAQHHYQQAQSHYQQAQAQTQ